MALDDLLADLNAAIDRWNAEADEDVELGEATRKEADAVKLKPGMATAELIRRSDWPAKFVQVVLGPMVDESPEEVVRLVESVPEEKRTEIIRQLGYANKKAVKHKIPTVMVHTLHLAHLLSLVPET